jgi:hypothetical protein
MTSRRLIVLAILFFLIVACNFLIPTPRLVVWGLVTNEPFFRNRPVCWWRHELRHWRSILERADIEFRLDIERSDDPSNVYEHMDAGAWIAPGDAWVRMYSPFEEWLHEFFRIKTTQALPLLQADPAALPVLVELLKDEDVKTRIIALAGLCYQGTHAASALPAIRELVNDRHYNVRQMARYALESIDPEKRRVWDEMLKAQGKVIEDKIGGAPETDP